MVENYAILRSVCLYKYIIARAILPCQMKKVVNMPGIVKISMSIFHGSK